MKKLFSFFVILIALTSSVLFINAGDVHSQSDLREPVQKVAHDLKLFSMTPNGTDGPNIIRNVPSGLYPTIQSAINAANNGDIIMVASGTYVENITLNKPLSIRGANYGINPNTGSRVTESIIRPATSDPDPYSAGAVTFFYIGANGSSATIDGFTLDGDNPSLTSAVNINGANIDAAEAFGAYDGLANSTISNNIIKNVNYAGIDFYNFTSGGAATFDNVIANNKFDNMNVSADFGIGVLIYNNCYAAITDNVMTRTRIGVQTGNFTQADLGTSHSISNNDLETYRLGVFHNLHYLSATAFNITNNEITTVPGALRHIGIEIASIQSSVGVNIIDNNITDARWGYQLWNCPTTNTVTITGGLLTDCQIGVFPNNYDGYNSNADPSVYAMTGVTITGSDTAIWIRDNSLNSNLSSVILNVNNTTNIVNGTGIGLLLEGGDAAVIFNGAAPVDFSATLTKYIRLTTNGSNVPSGNINAQNVQFGGTNGSGMTNPQLFAVEDKIDHRIDWTNLGFVSVKANNNYVTLNSFYTPNTTSPLIARGIDAASTGYTVNLDAATFNENVDVNKAVTLSGSGPTSTILTPSVACTGNGISVTSPSAGVRNLRVTNFTYGIVTSSSGTNLYNVESVGNCSYALNTTSGTTGLNVIKCKFNNNIIGGWRTGTADVISNILFDSCEVKSNGVGVNNGFGIFVAATTHGTNTADNITIRNSDFSNNLKKGMYFEKLRNAMIDNVIINNSGIDATYGFNNGIDLNLKYDSYTDITIQNCSITNCGVMGTATNVDNPSAVTIKARDDSPSYNTDPATLTNVNFKNNFVSGPVNGLRFGEFDKVNNSPTANTVIENHFGNGYSNKAVLNKTANNISISCNWYGTTTPSAVVALHGPGLSFIPYLNNGTDNDAGAAGFQPVPGSCTGVGPVANLTQSTSYSTIQQAINDADPNDVLEASAGSYNERVVIDKSLTLQGVNETTVIITGTGLAGNGKGIQINSGITNVIIKKVTVQNFSGTNGNMDAGIYGIGGNNNLTVQNVTIQNNVGGSGFYANGPVNTVLLDSITSTGHTVSARGIVIWNGLKENITITRCHVFGNNCCGVELQDGTATGVTFMNNNIHDNADNGIGLMGLQGPGENLIKLNTLVNNGRFGMEIKNPNGSGLATGPGRIVVEDNNVSRSVSIGDARDIVGIAAFRRSVGPGNVEIPTGVVIQNNTVTGYTQSSTSDGFGIVVEGTNHKVLTNTVSGCDVGIQRQAGHLPGPPGDGDQNNLADTYFGRGNSPITCGITLTGNILSNTIDTRDVGSTASGIVKNVNTNEMFCSIQSAIDDPQTLNGHVINIDSGYYNESVVVNKQVTLQGNNGAPNPRPVVEGVAGQTFSVSVPNVTINNLQIKFNQGTVSAGVRAAASGTFNNLTINNCLIHGTATTGAAIFNSFGIQVGSFGGVLYDQVNLDNNEIKHTGTSPLGRGVRTFNCYGDWKNSNIEGFYTFQSGDNQGGILNITNNTLKGSAELNNFGTGAHSFNNNICSPAAAFGPGTDFALLELKNISFAGSSLMVQGNTFQGYVNFGVFSGRANNVTFNNNSFTPDAAAVNFRSLRLDTKQRTTAVQTAFASGAVITNNTFNGNAAVGQTGISVELANSDNVSTFAAVTLGTAVNENDFGNDVSKNISLNNETTVTTGDPVWNGTYTSTKAKVTLNVDAINNNYNVGAGLQLPSAMSLANLFLLEDKIQHKIDDSGIGLVTVKANNNYVTLNSFVSPATTTPSIQRAIDAASVGFTSNVANGTFNGEININKSMTVDGESTAAIIRAPYTGSGNTVLISSSNATLKDVTVTRDYGVTLTDWNNSTQNQGINVGQTTTGTVINNVVMTGNRNAIFVNNAQSVTITQCTIENNRTGIHFGNNITGAEVHNNIIRNNFTHGVLFNYDLALTIVATNVHVTDNTIYGNWYSQVNFQRNSGGPVTGDHTGLLFSCNWYGTATPLKVAANAAEPGYTSQVPSQFGGTDPGLNRQLYGTEIARCPYSPFLTDGTDFDLLTAGFQPVPTACNGYPATSYYVNDNSIIGDVYTTAIGNNVNPGTAALPFLTINYAVSIANPDDTIYVDAGLYVEQVLINKSLTVIGADSGGTSASTIKAPATLTLVPNANAADHAPVIYVSGPTTDVNISKVCVDGDGRGGKIYGVYYFEASGTFTNSRITKVRDATFSGVQTGNAFFANHTFDVSVAQSVTVSYNVIDDFQKTGILINELNTQGIVTNNIVIGQNTQHVNGQNGIQFGYGAYGTITGNTISNSLYNGPAVDAASGILLAGVGVNQLNVATGNTTTVGGAGSLANTMNGCETGLLVDAGGFGYNSNQGVIYDVNNFNNNYIHVSESAPNTVPSALNVYDKRVDNTALTNIVYGRIMRAVDGATTGHTLNVSAGTFPENVTLTKTLTMNGAKVGVDARGRVVGSPNPATESVVSPVSGAALELMTGSSSTVIDGFSMLGVVLGTQGVIQTQSPTAQTSFTQIKNNFVKNTGAQGAAMWFNRGITDVTISNNEIVGGTTSSSTQNIFLNNQSFAGMHFLNNNVLGSGGTYGIFVDGNRNVGTSATPRDPLFQGNLFQGLVAGMNGGVRSLDNAQFLENTFNNNSQLGFQGGPRKSNFARNTFTNNGLYGISLTGFNGSPAQFADTTRGSSKTTIQNNFFSGNATAPGAFGDVLLSNEANGMQASNTITNNSLTSTIAIYNNEPGGGTDVIKAECNWFGTTSAATITTKVFNTPGGIVDFIPFLNNGTDNDGGTPGFQPVPSSCVTLTSWYVNDNSTSGDHYTTALGNDGNPGTSNSPFATMNHAVAVSADGDTIFVDAGTFVENVVVNKYNLSIRGSNYGINPNTGSRLAESIVMPAVNDPELGVLFEIQKSKTNIDGFLFNGDNPSLTGGYAVGPADVNTSEGICNGPAIGPFYQIDTTNIKNNTFNNFDYQAVYLEVNFNTNHSWNYVTDNKFDNMWEGVQTYALHVDVSRNVFTAVDRAISMHGINIACDPGFVPRIDSNEVSISWKNPNILTRNVGIWVNYRRGTAPPLSVNRNTLHYPSAAPSGKIFNGFYALTITEDRVVSFRNNTIDGQENCSRGFYMSNSPSLNVSLKGGAFNNIKEYGLLIVNNDATWGPGDAKLTVDSLPITMSPGSTSGAAVETNDAFAMTPMGSDRAPERMNRKDPAELPKSEDNGRQSSATFLGALDISHSSVTGSLKAISVKGMLASANIHDNSMMITGASVGVDVDGGGTVTLRRNSITANATGVYVKNNGNVTYATENFITSHTSEGIHIDADAGTIGTISENNLSGNTGYAINYLKTSPPLVATCNWYGAVDAPTVGAEINGNVTFASWLTNGTDNNTDTLGFQPVPGTCNGGQVKYYVNDNVLTNDTYTSAIGNDANPGTPALPFATIRHAMAIANNSDTIYVDAGAFAENDSVYKSLTIIGAGQGLTFVRPSVSGLTCGGGSLCPGGSNVMLIGSNNVTLKKMTIDGDNPSLTSGVVVGGADLDARNGIITNHTLGIFNGLLVDSVTVKNVYLRGIYASSGGTFTFSHDSVNNVQADAASIAMFNFGGSGIFSNNTVSNANDGIASNHSTGSVYYGNTVTTSGSGIHTDNNGDGGGIADTIRNNTVTNSAAFGYGVWVFAPYRNVMVKENTVTNVDVGMANAGQGTPVITTFMSNSVDGQNKPGSTGVYQTTSLFGFGSSNVKGVYLNNVIKNNTDGFYIEYETGYTNDIVVNDNTIKGNTNGASLATGGTLINNFTCNWWGSASASDVATAVSAPLNYVYFLTDGTDNDLITAGFQPVPGTCNGQPLDPNFGTLNGYSYANSTAGASGFASQPDFCWMDTTGSTSLAKNTVNSLPGVFTGDLDDGYWKIVLPAGKKVRFFGNNYDTVRIGTNGIISFQVFDPASGNNNPPSLGIPGGAVKNAFYPLWWDQNWGILNPATASNRLSYKVVGNQLIVTYNNAPRYLGASGDYVSYQVCIDVSSAPVANSRLLVQFADTTNQRTGALFASKYLSGTNQTHLVGLQNAAGSMGVQYRFANSSTTVLTPGPLFDTPFSSMAVQFGSDSTQLNHTCQSLNLTFRLEAIQLTRRDTVTVMLRGTTAPNAVIEAVKVVYDSLTGSVTVPYTLAENGSSYYIFVKHRSSISTWSAAPVACASNALVYDFTTAISQAFMNNMKMVSGKASFFTGEVDGNGVVGLTDITSVFNDNVNFVTGNYVVNDLDYNGVVNGIDVIYVANNNVLFVTQKNPPGAIPLFSGDPVAEDKSEVVTKYTKDFTPENTKSKEEYIQEKTTVKAENERRKIRLPNETNMR